MDKGDLARLKHMKRYCEDVEITVNRFGNTLDVFSKDIDFYNSVSMSIMQIGELANGLSERFRESTREQMPWGLIIGMRNHFAHGYATMDKSDIWETAEKDIPILLEFCAHVIKNSTIKSE